MTNENNIIAKADFNERPITAPGDFDGDTLNIIEGVSVDLISKINYVPGMGKSMFAYSGRPYQRLVLPIHPIVKKDDYRLTSLFEEERIKWDKCLFQTFPSHYIATYQNSRMKIMRVVGLTFASADPAFEYYLKANHMLDKRMPRYTLLDPFADMGVWMTSGMYDRLSRYDKKDTEVTEKLFKTFTPIVIDSMESSKPNRFNRTGRAYPTKGRN